MIDDIANNTVYVTFSRHWQVPYGKALYLIGNTFDLGEWDLKKSHRLSHRNQNIWYTTIRLPIQMIAEYKYFTADYNSVDENNIEWENMQGNHFKKVLAVPNPPLPITICSFNIRYQTPRDKGNTHWDSRKGRIVQFSMKKKYDIIGVQEATFPQRKFLEEYLKQYHYFGKPRDLKKDEQCGIFVHESYEVIESSFDWISQTKKEGSVGYDAKLPRYFTSVVVTNKFNHSSQKKLPCILIINLHLDHEGKLARKKGIEHVLQKCINMRKKYQEDQILNLVGCVVMGDFNASEKESIFSIFMKNQQMPLKSMREIEGADRSFTFNGFKNKWLLKIGQYILNDELTIDHMFYWFKQNSHYRPIQFRVEKPETQIEILSDHYPIMGVIDCRGMTVK